MKSSKIFLTVLITILALSSVAHAVNVPGWSEAPPNPPENNAPTPINVTNVSQKKDGGLTLGGKLVVKNIEAPDCIPGSGLLGGFKCLFGSVVNIGTGDLTSNDSLSVDNFLIARGILATKMLGAGESFQYATSTAGDGKVLISTDSSGSADWADFSTLYQKCIESGACSSAGVDSNWTLLPNNNLGNLNSNKNVELAGKLVVKNIEAPACVGTGFKCLFGDILSVGTGDLVNGKASLVVDNFLISKALLTTKLLVAGEQFQYGTSTAGEGKVLISTDSSGAADWADFSTLYQNCVETGSCPTGGDGFWIDNPTDPLGVVLKEGKENVSVTGKLGVVGDSTFSGTSSFVKGVAILPAANIELGYSVAGKETTAGKIIYDPFSLQALNIYGGGLSKGKRLVNIYDNLNVKGTTTANAYCIEGGSCVTTLGSNVVPGTAINQTLRWEASQNKWLPNSSMLNDGTRASFGDAQMDPYSKVYIKGKVRILDGTEKDNRILVSDLGGLASWKDASAIPGVGDNPFHSADVTKDWKIDATERAYVETFYNAGSYHCDANAYSGYAPGGGNRACNHHSADPDGDWKIDLGELNRVIQFYNIASGYDVCLFSEDGFKPNGAGYPCSADMYAASSSIQDGSTFGQTLFWDNVSKLWKASSNLINNDKVTDPYVEASNFRTSGSLKLVDGTSATSQFGTISAAVDGWLEIQGSPLFPDIPNSRAVKIKDFLSVPSLIVSGGTKGVNRILADVSGDGMAVWTDPATLGLGDTNWLKTGNNISNTNTANVGIGTSNPTVKLSLGTDITQKKLAVYDGTNQFYGFGLRSGLLDFLAGDVTRMSIAGATGNVGIGANPDATAKLSVAGNLSVAGKFKLADNTQANGYILQSNATGVATWVATSTLGLAAGTDSNWTRTGNNISNANSANVGIGTNAPESLLSVGKAVSGGRGGEISIANTASPVIGNEAALNFSVGNTVSNNNYGGNAGDAQIKARSMNSNNNATDLIFSTYDGASFGERMRLVANGSVGIGTNNPTAKLQVNGSVVINGNTMLDNGLTDGARMIWRGGAGATDEFRVRVDANGSLGFFPAKNGTVTTGQTDTLSLTRTGVVDVNGVLETKNFRVRPDQGPIPIGSAPAIGGANQTVLVAGDIYGNAIWKPLSTLCAGGVCGAGGTTLPNGSTGQTLSWNGSWTPNSAILNTGTLVTISARTIHTDNLQVNAPAAFNAMGNAAVMGNLGVGVLSPTTKLDVVGKVRIADGSQLNGRILTSGPDGTATWKDAPVAVVNTDNQQLSLTGSDLLITASGGTGQVGSTIHLPKYTVSATDATAVTAGFGAPGTSLTNVFTINNQTALWNANSIQGKFVTANTPTANQVLRWNGSAWSPSNDGLPVANSGNTNQLLRSNGTNAWVAGGTSLVTDGTKVGIGTTNLTMTQRLRVVGGALFDTVRVNNPIGRFGWATMLADGTIGAGSTASILNRCSWNNPNSSGSYNKTCDVVVNPATDLPPNPTNTNNDFIFYCPAGYSVISGGGWCDDDYYLRESRPESTNGGVSEGWKISCQKNGVITPSRSRPGGASLMCAAN